MTILASPDFLRLCEQSPVLKQQSCIREGRRVARGFADLGHEEFLVLPGLKLLSLESGKLADLPVDHMSHFFWVPTIEELLVEVGSVADITRVSFVEQRKWEVEVSLVKDSKVLIRQDRYLQAALLQILNEVPHAI